MEGLLPPWSHCRYQWAPSYHKCIHFILGCSLLHTALHNRCLLFLVTEQLHTLAASWYYSTTPSIIPHTLKLPHLSILHLQKWGCWHISECSGVTFCSSTSNLPTEHYCTWILFNFISGDWMKVRNSFSSFILRQQLLTACNLWTIVSKL